MSRKFVNFVKKGVLGVNEVAGDFGGFAGGVMKGVDLTFVSLLFFLVFRRWQTKKLKGKRNTLLSLFR